jgi:flagellar motor switch protein FliG
MRPLYEEDGMELLDTHYYGMIKAYQWTGIPLALHGVIIRKDGSAVTVRIGEEPDDPVLFIADLLPHLGKEQMERPAASLVKAEDLDILAGLYSANAAGDGAGAVARNILRILARDYGIGAGDLLSAEIAAVRGIPSDEAAAVLDEFASLLSGAYDYGGAGQGGVNEARRLLYAAFGPEKGEALLRRSVPASNENGLGRDSRIFSFLEDFSGEQIAMLLRDESAATGALILSRLKPETAASVLRSSQESWRQEAVRRIGRLGRVSPEVLEQVASGLREKAHRSSIYWQTDADATNEPDGKSTLAAILKHTDISFGEKILGQLAESDADLSSDIKEKLYTLDDVVNAEDKPIQLKLQNMNAKDIAILIKGRPEAFAEKILGNMSAHRRSEVREESDFAGPITKKDSEAAMRAFMEWFRGAREKGEIILGDDFV